MYVVIFHSYMYSMYHIYIYIYIISIYIYGKTQILENCLFKFKYPNFEDSVLELKEDHGISVYLIGSLNAGCKGWIAFISKAL